VPVAVHEIHDSEAFAREVLQTEGPVVVDFYADWCAPCRHVSPVIDALSEKWASAVRFAKLDVDSAPEVAAALGIRSIPTVAMFESGQVTAAVVGAGPEYLFERELGLTRFAQPGSEPDGVPEEDEVHVGDPPERQALGPLAAIRAWWRGS
jgi:thioredoxin 1